MVCLGFEPRASGWKVQMNPLSYSAYLILLLENKILWWLDSNDGYLVYYLSTVLQPLPTFTLNTFR